MEAWIELKEKTELWLWDRFIQEFSFKPRVGEQDWPGIREPTPSETYLISEAYAGTEPQYIELCQELQEWGLRSFQTLLKGETNWLYALDWQHPCYQFYPEFPFELDEFGEWVIPLLPNGDYYIFLESEFKWGIFGHPWEQTMCVFGAPLLNQLKSDPPRLLTQLIRRDGEKI